MYDSAPGRPRAGLAERVPSRAVAGLQRDVHFWGGLYAVESVLAWEDKREEIIGLTQQCEVIFWPSEAICYDRRKQIESGRTR
jgi:hypothetical protein